MSFLYWGSQTTAEAEGSSYFPQPAGHMLANIAQDGAGLHHKAVHRVCSYAAGRPPAYTALWGFSSPGAGLHICLC